MRNVSKLEFVKREFLKKISALSATDIVFQAPRFKLETADLVPYALVYWASASSATFEWEKKEILFQIFMLNI